MKFSLLITAFFVLSVIFVALILKTARRKKWYDRKSDRKVHQGNIPRLGGMGFAAAFIILALFITVFGDTELSPGFRFLFPLLGLTIVTVLGIVDDFHELRPGLKFIVHCLAALFVIVPGYTFNRPFFFESGPFASLGWLKYPFSFIWIVGMTNAVNFIDGVDGLAGGVSLFISLSYAGVFLLLTNVFPGMLVCFCLAAAILGFLVFNAPFPKARIFMGDGGAYFLGFILALLPLTVHIESADIPPMFYIAALVLIPVYDTVAAIWRRIRDRKKISEPDKFHVHHKLMNLGLNSLQITITLCGLQIILGILVLAAIRAKGPLSLVLLGLAYLCPMGFFAAIHFMNRGLTISPPPPPREAP